jgi:hypothetical protein
VNDHDDDVGATVRLLTPKEMRDALLILADRIPAQTAAAIADALKYDIGLLP